MYPRAALDKALDALSGASRVAADLGYNSREMTEDVDRLRTAAEKHWNGEEKEEVAADTKMKGGSRDKKVALEVINNLAREKFGAAATATSPKKTNIKRQQFLATQKRGQTAKKKQNVVLPRGNRLLEERARLARAKRMMADQSMPESDDGRKRVTTFSVDHFPDAATSITTPRPLSSRVSLRPHSRCSSGLGGRRTIDLDEDELEHILKHRRRQIPPPRPTSLQLGTAPESSFSLAGLLADKLVGEAVRDVCQEVAGVDMVTRLFKSEFKL